MSASYEPARALLEWTETKAFLDAMERHAAGQETRPDWRDIDPLAFPAALPHVWMYERVGGEDVYFCRLVGEAVRAHWRIPMRGRTAREIAGDRADLFFIEPLDALIDQDVIGVGVSPTGRVGLGRAERVIVPIRRGDNPAVFGCSVYVPAIPFGAAPDAGAIACLSLFGRRDGAAKGRYLFRAE